MTRSREPIYDLGSAIDVLSSGRYTRLPLIIKKTFVRDTEVDLDEGKERMHDLMRQRLHSQPTPLPFLENVKFGMLCATQKMGVQCFSVWNTRVW